MVGRKKTLFLLALLLTVWLAHAQAQDKVSIRNRASLSLDYDDNVFKTNRDVDADFRARLYYDMMLNMYPTLNNLIYAKYQGGASKYFEFEDQDTLVNLIRLGYTNSSMGSSYLGTEAGFKLRNIRSGEEDYNKFNVDLFAGHEFEKGITGEIRGGYTRFDFRTFNYYDYWLHRYGFLIQKAFGSSLNFAVQYYFQEKHFPFNAFENIGADNGEVFLAEKDEKRRDILHEPAIYIRYNKWLLVDFSYLMQINESNSYGDSYYNHRLSLSLAKTIVKGTNLHLFGVAQFRDSYEKVLIPHSYSIEEDDENYNSAAAALSQRVTDWMSVEFEYSRYWTNYSSSELNFIKNLYSIGVTFKF